MELEKSKYKFLWVLLFCFVVCFFPHLLLYLRHRFSRRVFLQFEKINWIWKFNRNRSRLIGRRMFAIKFEAQRFQVAKLEISELIILPFSHSMQQATLHVGGIRFPLLTALEKSPKQHKLSITNFQCAHTASPFTHLRVNLCGRVSTFFTSPGRSDEKKFFDNKKKMFKIFFKVFFLLPLFLFLFQHVGMKFCNWKIILQSCNLQKNNVNSRSWSLLCCHGESRDEPVSCGFELTLLFLLQRVGFLSTKVLILRVSRWRRDCCVCMESPWTSLLWLLWLFFTLL